MADLVELSAAEHLFEYARQMVRCETEVGDLSLSFSNAVHDELDKLTEMVAGLTASQASNDHASTREEG